MREKPKAGGTAMHEEQRRKLQALKSRNKEHIKELQLKNNTLYQECLNAIRTYCIVGDKAAIDHILKIASDQKIKKVHHPDRPTLDKNRSYYVIWDNGQVPVIKCSGNDIMEHWDDVIAVAFDTCFVDSEDENGVLVRGI